MYSPWKSSTFPLEQLVNGERTVSALWTNLGERLWKVNNEWTQDK